MATNVRHAQDSIQLAWVTAQQFMAQYLKDWNAPIIQRQVEIVDRQLVSAWDSMPEAMHNQVRQSNPEAYNRAKLHVEELRRKYHDRLDRTSRRLTK